MSTKDENLNEDAALNILKSRMTCKKEFCCTTTDECLCQAEDIGVEGYLECREENPFNCDFSVSFGRGHLCSCPVRVYIKKTKRR